MSDTETITVTVELLEEQAWAFAEFLKRVQPEDYERRADPHDGGKEAAHMYDAGVLIRRALRQQGIDPR